MNRIVLVEADYHVRPPLWNVPSPEEEAEGRRIAKTGRWRSGLTSDVSQRNSGWPISERLKQRLNAWADVWEGIGGEAAEHDEEWLSLGQSLVAEVQQELGPEYEVRYGHSREHWGEEG